MKMPDQKKPVIFQSINVAAQDVKNKPSAAGSKATGTLTDQTLQPAFLRVCSKDEYKIRKSGRKPYIPKPPYYAHGSVMYAIKAGLIAGVMYFTYREGVWGDQRQAAQCVARWREYFRSINTRRPPVYDRDGEVVNTNPDSDLIAPVYGLYKGFIVACFSGLVNFPLKMKCAYVEYQEAMEKKHAEEKKMKGR